MFSQKTKHRFLIEKLSFGLLTTGIALHLPAAAQQVYQGVCDASAAIAVDAVHFLVAEDENDVLWIYRNDKPRNKPIGGGFDLSSRLRSDPKRESDIEGAAASDIFRGLLTAIVFGTISPNIRMRTVMAATLMPTTPCSKKRLTTLVPMLAAATLTRVFPIKIVTSRW